jgi:hypothetical protein
MYLYEMYVYEREICLWDTRLWFGLKNTVCHVFVYRTL